MSKITKALYKASQERDLKADIIKASNIERSKPIRGLEGGAINNSWLIWVFLIGAIAGVLIVFNMSKGKDAVPLTEIFPDEEVYPIDVEYEFVDNEGKIKNIVEKAPEVKAVASKVQPANEINPKDAAVAAMPEQKIAQKIVNAEPAKAEAVIPSAENLSYTIQVASFKDKNKAETKLTELEKKGYKPFILSRDLADKGIWYRVYVGSFSTRDEAQSYLSKVKADYPDSFIITPKK